MALSSMTGFAQHGGEAGGLNWSWELRSVNGKALDVRFRLPAGCEGLEMPARNLVAQKLKRGNIQASLSVTLLAPSTGVVVNEAVLGQLVTVAEQLRKRLKGPPLAAEALLGLRGVIEPAQQGQQLADMSAHHETLLGSFSDAVEKLDAARRSEGSRLHAVIAGQLDRIESLTQQARDCPARMPDAIRKKLAEQVARLMDGTSSLDPERLHQEAIVLATRADVQEELDRLSSHIESARDLVQSQEPAGRKFEFLTQEFNREANTLCSKSSDRGLTAIGLELKTVIDQLREQVQNIE